MMDAFVLDRPLILQRLKGDDELLAMIAGMFVQEVDEHCALLADALAGADPVALARHVHTVKGLLATVSDEQGARMAEAIGGKLRGEQLLGEKLQLGVAAGIESDIASLQARLREVAAALAAA